MLFCWTIQTRGELLRAGECCIGERHGEIIDGQKEAITQLKHELADAMLARPPGTVHMCHCDNCWQP